MAYRTLMKVFLVISMASNVYGVRVKCCLPGQILIRNRTSAAAFCRTPNTTSTSPIPITCDDIGYIEKNEFDFKVNTFNELVIRVDQNLEVEYKQGSYCVANATTVRDKNFTRVKLVAALCPEEEIKVLDGQIFGYCMFVSSLFLFITAAIYTSFHELRDLLGKSIINFCISLGIGLAILAAMKIVPYSDMKLCAARGFLTYYFLIVSFFWSNAISIQIFLHMKRPLVLNYGWKEFTWYSIYAWGTPAILASIMAVVNFTPGSHLKPGLGLNHCWFFNSKQQWWYMYSVMTLLIVVNICIFIYTSILLWRQSFSSSHIIALRFKFVMTTRLFFVMGVPWIFEMVGSLSTSHILWEIIDLFNSLQGVSVFLVLVVFRRRVFKLMYQRGWLDCVSKPVERCLAVGEDEEEVVQHTVGMSLEDPKTNGIK